jgi:DNA-3-methyladenine glycosylase I
VEAALTGAASSGAPMSAAAKAVVRCPWAMHEPAISYHDTEWGVPQHDDRMLFELLTLEGAQAGLSWDTILKKRDGYRIAFANFDPVRVARFDARRVEELVLNPQIVRHRGKIVATIANAKAFLRVQTECGSFDAYLWKFVDGIPIVTRRPPTEELPGSTDLSDTISVDLKKRGFTFVGSTIVYAFLQATGVVDDHRATCFRAQKAKAARKRS